MECVLSSTNLFNLNMPLVLKGIINNLYLILLLNINYLKSVKTGHEFLNSFKRAISF